ncbi:MAG: hypothetical protein QXT63_08140 [Thermoplasmata archaeon]
MNKNKPVKQNPKVSKPTSIVSLSHKKNERQVKQMPKPIIDADTEEDMVQFFVTQPKSQAEGGREDY